MLGALGWGVLAGAGWDVLAVAGWAMLAVLGVAMLAVPGFALLAVLGSAVPALTAAGGLTGGGVLPALLAMGAGSAAGFRSTVAAASLPRVIESVLPPADAVAALGGATSAVALGRATAAVSFLGALRLAVSAFFVEAVDFSGGLAASALVSAFGAARVGLAGAGSGAGLASASVVVEAFSVEARADSAFSAAGVSATVARGDVRAAALSPDFPSVLSSITALPMTATVMAPIATPKWFTAPSWGWIG